MDVLIVTIITSASAIVGAIIAAIISSRATNSLVKRNELKIDNGKDALSKEHDGLSKEHDGLSKEHDGLSKEHSEISGYIEKIESIVTDTQKTVLSEKTKQEFRYSNLTDKQKDISQSINAIELMHSEMKRLQSEQVSLYSKIEALKQQNIALQQDLRNEKMRYNRLERQLDEDEQER